MRLLGFARRGLAVGGGGRGGPGRPRAARGAARMTPLAEPRATAEREAPADGGTVLSIQYLRGLAAMAVAAVHLVGRSGSLFETGAAGVDLFFVISGFVMWTIASRRPVAPGRFLLDRLTRIAPPYVLLTFVVYLVAVGVPGVFPNMRTNLSHAVLSALFIPHTDPLGTAFPQLAPGWTLNIEVFFYAAVALALLLPARARLRTLTIGLALLVLLGLAVDTTNATVNAYTSPLLMEFVAGLWLGLAWERRLLPRAPLGLAAALAGLLLLAAWEVLRGDLPGLSRVLVWGVPALLIVGGLLAIERDRGLPRSRALLALGDASYAIYLVNVLVVGIAWRLFDDLPFPLYMAVGLVASAAAGFLFRWTVELSLTRAARRLADRPSPVARPA